MALFWLFSRSLLTRHAYVLWGEVASRTVYDVETLALGVLILVLALACIVSRGRVGRTCCSYRSVVVAGVSGFVGSTCLALDVFPSAPSVALGVVGVPALAVGVFALLVGWGVELSRDGAARAILSSALGYALSVTVRAVIELLVSPVGAVVLILSPIGSTVCLLLLQRQANQGGLSYLPPEERVGGMGGRPWGSLPWGTLVPAIALIWFEQVFSKMLSLTSEGDLTQVSSVVPLIFMAVICLAVALYVRRGGKTVPYEYLDPVFVGLLLVYMVSLLLTVMFMGRLDFVPEQVLVAAGSCMRVYVWAVLLAGVCSYGTDPCETFSIFGLFILGVPLNVMIGLFLSEPSRQQLAWTVVQPSFVVPVAAFVLFVFGVAFALGRLHPRSLPIALGNDGQPESDLFEDALLSAGLTEREIEVVRLICSGNSAKAISDKLGIARSTVVTHTTHVYRKLGIANKQELIDYVDRARKGLDNDIS